MSQTARGPSLSLAGRPGRRTRLPSPAPGPRGPAGQTGNIERIHHRSPKTGPHQQARTGHTRNRAPPRQQQAGTTSTSAAPGRRPGATGTRRAHPKPRFTPHPAAGRDNEHVRRPRPKTGRHKHPPDTPETALHPAPAAGRDNEHVHRPRPKTGRHKHPPDTPKAPLHPAPSSRPGQRARPVPGARAAVPSGRPPPRPPGHAKPRSGPTARRRASSASGACRRPRLAREQRSLTRGPVRRPSSASGALRASGAGRLPMVRALRIRPA
ncbi:hypothetical protein M2164_005235 [Streptomyces sp. SAI-208]|nr:hypothetical protein [Streptomyces sp. SAI-208]